MLIKTSAGITASLPGSCPTKETKQLTGSQGKARAGKQPAHHRLREMRSQNLNWWRIRRGKRKLASTYKALGKEKRNNLFSVAMVSEIMGNELTP